MEPSTLLLIGFVILLVLLVVTVFTIVWYSGLFTDVIVGAGKPPVGSLVTVYKFGRGPYSDTGPVFTESVSIGPDKRTFGIYYDDPKQVPADKLRWAVGSIIAEGGEETDFQLIGQYQEFGFKPFHTPAVSNAVKTSFPYTTPFSIFIAIFRVYPSLGAYIKEKKLCAHPFMEVYSGDTIHFWAPLAKQDQFYVPEANEEELETSEEPTTSTSQASETVKTSDNKDSKESGGGGDSSQNNKEQVLDSPRIEVNESGEPKICRKPVQPLAEQGLIPPRQDSRSRSTSAVSFQTAREVPITSQPSSVVSQEKTGTPEGVQDSGISSTSSATPTKSCTPAGANVSDVDKPDSSSCFDSSSSRLDSSGTSVDSYSGSSFNSSYTSQSGSSCTEVSSFASESSFTETGSLDYSTEKSCDLMDVSGESDLDGKKEEGGEKKEDKE